MVKIDTEIDYKEIYFNEFDSLDDKYLDISEVYSTLILEDRHYDIFINSNVNVKCDRLIIYCDNFENNGELCDKYVNKQNVDCVTLIIKANEIKSKQLNILLRKEKIKKLLGL